MNNQPLIINALILAGGQSSRMGQDKALLPWDGVPLLKRVCQVAAACCQQVYILTPWPQRYQEVIAIGECEFLLESNPGQGPLVALAQGLEQISADWVLLLACDLPILRTDTLQHWKNGLNQQPANILALVPRQVDRWEPLCGFYRRDVLPLLQQFIQRGGRSFQTWLDEVPVQPLPVGEIEAEMLWNCNTPKDMDHS